MGTHESEVVFVDIFTSTKNSLVKVVFNILAMGRCHLRCVVAFPKLDLIARPGSYNDNGNVGLLCRLNCFIKPRFITAPAFASLGIIDCCFVANCGFNTIQWGDTAVLAFVDDIITILR